MKLNQFSARARLAGFRYAWSGLCALFRTEPNAWIHLLLTIAAISAAWLLGCTRTEWLLIGVVTGMVWTAELFNTSIEKIMDMISPGRHPQVKIIKDMAAAAVLVTAVIAMVTGSVIFISKLCS